MLRRWSSQLTHRGFLELIAVVALLGCCGPKPPPGGNAQKRLPVPFHFQEDNQLCWAAGVEMLTDYPPAAERRVSQCQQATDAWTAAGTTGPKDCCHLPPGQTCNFRSEPRFDRYDYRFKRGTPGCYLRWDQIKAEIEADRPFLYDYKYDGADGAHLEAVVGYQQLDNEQTLFVYDPEAGVKIEWFASHYVRGPDFKHQLDYFEVTFDPPNKGRRDVACE